MQLDFAKIQNTIDRSFVPTVLDAVENCKGNKQLRAIEALSTIGDYRASDRLYALIENNDLPVNVRKACLSAIEWSIELYPSDYKLREWWDSNDPILQELILPSLNDPEVVLPIASDKKHPWHNLAITALAFNFDEHTDLIVQALTHPDLKVRKAAAEAVVYAEPIAAEEPLLRLVDDTDDSAAAIAITTLEYWRTRKVLKKLTGTEVQARLNSESSNWDEEKGWIESLRYMFSQAYVDHPELRTWLNPVLNLLALDTVEADSTCFNPPTDEKIPVYLLKDFVACYNDFDSQWKHKEENLHRFDWRTVPSGEVNDWFEYLSNHPYVVVRKYAVEMADTHDRSDLLITLIEDHTVEKMAILQLSQTSPDLEVAKILSQRLDQSRYLESYIHHAGKDTIQKELLQMAFEAKTDQDRAYIASNLDTEHAIKLLPLLEEPPLVNWRFHTTMLNMCYQAKIKPTWLPELERVEHLDLAKAVAQFNA